MEKKELNHELWNSIVDGFSEYRENVEVTSLFKKFCTMITTGNQILDVGCGTGVPHVKYLTEKKFKVLGIDFSTNMINRARKNIPDAIFKIESIEKINYVDRYDGIVASYSLQLIDRNEIPSVIHKLSKAMKNYALIYISVNEIHNNSEPFTKVLGKKMYFRDYSLKEMEDICYDYNLRLIDVDRKIEISEEFGDERMIEFIFEKIIE